jgi:two-component system, NtrC family, sensor kinase
VGQMRDDEDAIRAGLELAMAVREQHIHAAHTIAVGDDSHAGHYAEWVRNVRQGADKLRVAVPSEQRWRLQRLLARSQAADRLFYEEVLVALRTGDVTRVRRAHTELDELLSVAATDADRVARSIEGRMSHAHMSTTKVTYLACAIALTGIIALIGLSVIFTRRLSAAVLRPLATLVQAADRVARGEYAQPALASAEGEFGIVASAFHRMAEELAERERKLVRHERMAAIGQLAAGVAHEINNPIGVIRGYLRTMIPEARSELRDELIILDEEARACQRIAEDLVAFARSPDLSKAPTEVSGLLHEVAARFRESGESENRAIEVEVEPAVVDIDGVRLRQVIQNLLRNAVQASAEGDEIEIRGDLRANAYIIRVLDRGEGIPAGIQARLFEPFQSGRPNGSGLGLAVCDGIVRAHGGTIEAFVREEGGTEFVIGVPVGDRQAEAVHV